MRGSQNLAVYRKVIIIVFKQREHSKLLWPFFNTQLKNSGFKLTRNSRIFVQNVQNDTTIILPGDSELPSAGDPFLAPNKRLVKQNVS